MKILYNNEKSFLLLNEYKNNISIISTFTKENNKINSNINISDDKLYRINEIDNVINFISSCIKENNIIKYDCINQINLKTKIFTQFPKITNGLLHFDIKRNNNSEINIFDIVPKLFIQFNKNNKIDLNIESNITDFITDKNKIFSIIFNKGFILAVAGKATGNVYFTLNNKKFIGRISKYYENMLYNITLIFNDIFEFIKNDKFIDIYLNKKINIDVIGFINLIKIKKIYNNKNYELSIIGHSEFIK